ncbi:MAG: hypothetical protein IAF94_08460 [Pirellulaceae bacterium]|nr:hypothetical protein [Pirellulaceae bacterium]
MEDKQKESRGTGCLICAAALTALVVLYVLSIGPASWIAMKYPATEKWLEAVYFPVLAFRDQFRPVEGALNWYMRFWIPA